ncbi:MAG: 50S ribosomal protein L6, partial [Bacteroidales bacterium]|nr:50S ribosomal protein L6 [Bacteroidales bacterium]
MSRIGKLPVSLPDKVSVEVLPGNVLKVKGPLGELSQKVDPDIKVTIEDNEIKFERPTDQPRHRSMHGLYRALVNNMVEGVSKGFETKQEFVGVGYRVSAQGQLVTMSLGYSHDIQLLLSPEIKAETPDVKKGENPVLILRSIDKQL